MSSLLNPFASYVPPFLLRRLAADPTPLSAPTAERFPIEILPTKLGTTWDLKKIRALFRNVIADQKEAFYDSNRHPDLSLHRHRR